MRHPTDKDRQEVKQYLLARLEAVGSMSYNLEVLFKEAIERIVKICFQFNLQPFQLNNDNIPEAALIRINEVIDWLNIAIQDVMDTLAAAAPDSDKDYILPWIRRERAGATFEERLNKYLDHFRFEMFLLTAAGIAVGFGSVPLVSSLIRNLQKPWNNPDIKEGIEKIPSYGIGRTNSMFTAINALTRDAVASAWMKSKFLNDKKRGAVGWWVERGSSIPCDICDPQTGFHYNDSQLPLYHLSCCCIATPVFYQNTI